MSSPLFQGKIKVFSNKRLRYRRRWFVITQEWISCRKTRNESDQEKYALVSDLTILVDADHEFLLLSDGHSRIYLLKETTNGKPANWIGVLKKICKTGNNEDILHLERFGNPVPKIWLPLGPSFVIHQENHNYIRSMIVPLVTLGVDQLTNIPWPYITLVVAGLKKLIELFSDKTTDEKLKRLIEPEVTDSLARQKIVEIMAEINSIKSSMEMLSQEGIETIKTLTISLTPHIFKILELFKNKEYIFKKIPAVFSTHLMEFANFTTLYVRLMWNFTDSRNAKDKILKILQEIKDTVIEYRDSCIKERFSLVTQTSSDMMSRVASKFKAIGYSITSPIEMLDNTKDRKYMDKRVIDSKYPSMCGTQVRTFYANVKERDDVELFEYYRQGLIDVYCEYFNSTLELIELAMEQSAFSSKINDESPRTLKSQVEIGDTPLSMLDQRETTKNLGEDMPAIFWNSDLFPSGTKGVENKTDEPKSRYQRKTTQFRAKGVPAVGWNSDFLLMRCDSADVLANQIDERLLNNTGTFQSL